MRYLESLLHERAAMKTMNVIRVAMVVALMLLARTALIASVTYDNSQTTHGFGVTTLTTSAFTITSSSNRAALVQLAVYAAGVTGITTSCGGVSGTLIAGTTVTQGANELRLYQVIAPPSGSQTCTASWTTSGSAVLSVMTASGVDQTTPFNNATTNSAANASSLSVTVTSNNGDLTASAAMLGATDAAQTTNQTIKVVDWSTMDVGPGTGNTTHTWSHAASANWELVGVNFNQAGGGGGGTCTSRISLLGVGAC